MYYLNCVLQIIFLWHEQLIFYNRGYERVVAITNVTTFYTKVTQKLMHLALYLKKCLFHSFALKI